MKRIICTICLMIILLIAGCSQSEDNKIVIKPRPESIKGLYNY